MKVACIGNIVYDCTVSSDSFPKEGMKSSYYDVLFNTGGPASNAASVVARFGSYVDFYGQIGKDTNGEYVYREMLSEGIHLDHVNKSDSVMTPFGFIVINTSTNTRTIYSLRSKVDFINSKIEKVDFSNDYDVILTDGKYVEDSINLIKKNRNAISVIDAGRVNDGILKLCKYIDYIICSEEFANNLTHSTLDDDYDNNARIYQKLKSLYPNAKGITITVGSKGYICEKDSEVTMFPAYDSGQKTIDTNGAGDIFHGAFTYAISNGYNYYDALEFANITASISTTRRGGRYSCPDLCEVKEAMNHKVLIKK